MTHFSRPVLARQAPEGAGELTVTPEHLQELKTIALTKIRNAAGAGRLLETPRLIRTLYAWREWGDASEVAAWVQGVIQEDEGLLHLMELLLQETVSHVAGDLVTRTGYRLDPEWISPFTDVNAIAERLMRMADSAELTERQRLAIAQYLKEYALRAQGQNPDFAL